VGDRLAARTAPVAGSRLAAVTAAVLGTDDPAAADRLTALAAHWPKPARLGLRAGAGLVDALARWRAGRGWSTLDAADRDRVLRTVTASRIGGPLVELLKVPMLAAATTAAATTASAGTAPAGTAAAGTAPAGTAAAGTAAAGTAAAGTVALARPDAELDCTPAQHWPTCTTADAVVVGSGAAGAMTARTLARAGLRVVVVEEGRRWTVDEFRSRPPIERFAGLYRGGGATMALGRPPILLPVGRAVGGTTVVNSGTCYRTPPAVLRRWRDDHGAHLADPDRFAALLDEVEATLRVAPQPMDVLGRNGRIALDGAAALGWPAAPLRRNAPGCAGSCQCAVGCPRNAKFGVHLNALPQACAAGARIVTNARAGRILVEHGAAVGVTAHRPDGTELQVLAPLVMVAAGATETPPLLRRSGLGGHPAMGRGLAVHPACSVAGRFPSPVGGAPAVMQSVGIEALHDQGILIEATASPAGIVSFPLPGIGSELAAELAASDHLATLGAMVADAPAGRVAGSRRPWVHYQLTRGDADKLRRAILAMGRLLFAAGADEVLTGLSRHPVARSPAELSAAVATSATSELHLAAFHPTGSVAMGADPSRAPVDPSGQLRGVTGVYVTDASLLPTCPGVNPQLTIMAMALGVSSSCASR